jgi:hypothetical protein
LALTSDDVLAGNGSLGGGDVGLGSRVDPKNKLNAASAAFGEGGIHTHRPKIIAKLLR